MEDKHKNIKDAEVVKNDTPNATPEKAAQPTNAAQSNQAAASAAGAAESKANTAQADAANTPEANNNAAAAGTQPDAKPEATGEKSNESNTPAPSDAKKPEATASKPSASDDDKKDTTAAASVGSAATASETGRNRKPLLAFIAGVLTAIVAWQLYSVITATQVDNSGQYPDPVAIVNGEPVDQELFEQNIEQTLTGAEAQGVNVTDEKVRSEFENQVLETIINTRLLVNAAAEAGYAPTEEEITERITELESQFESGGGLDAELEALGLSRADLNTDVTEQLSVDALLRNEVIPEEIAVSDEEVQEVYDGLIEAGQEMPPLEEVRQGIIAQVQQQKQQDLIQAYLDELRAAAEVEVNL